MKQKKQTLEAEVRFLRHQRKFLLKTRTSTSQEVILPNIQTTQYRKSKKEKVNNPKKAATLTNLLPTPNVIQRGKMYTKKKNIINNLGRNVNLYGVDLNQRVIGNNSFPVTEFVQKENGVSGEKPLVQARAPIFDLNQISCIGATTLDEYQKHIEKDLALERRFQPVKVPEPIVDETIQVLKGLGD
ncbi:putative P-loop containing nucleoside triphosphate hydrolase [Helianthus annuus]|nr:putative P-loop containing nucleoside triphosphate hydrolase [Helianthus annuus]